MSLPRTLSKLICRVLIGVFVFAQFAVAGYTCPGFGQAAPQSIEMQTEASSVPAGGCDQMDQQAPNLCAEHCHFGQQSSDTPSVPAVFAPLPALLYVLPEAQDAYGHASFPRDLLPVAAPPPHAILHCVLRI
jgi:hypothetical protein